MAAAAACGVITCCDGPPTPRTGPDSPTEIRRLWHYMEAVRQEDMLQNDSAASDNYYIHFMVTTSV